MKQSVVSFEEAPKNPIVYKHILVYIRSYPLLNSKRAICLLEQNERKLNSMMMVSFPFC